MNETPKISLLAILEQNDSKGYWLLDLLAMSVKEITHEQFSEAIHNNLVIVKDAKSFLQTHNIAPTARKLICLSTIKKIITTPQDDINMPAFSSGDEALRWMEKAANDMFDCITKYDLSRVVALECEVISATIAMEDRGLPFNTEKWRRQLRVIEQERDRIKDELSRILLSEGFALFGQEPIDLNNAVAVKAGLEKVLGRKLLGTSQSNLKDIDHEAVHLVLRFRELARMASAYGESFLEKVQNGRLRGHFTPIGSASGRFACHDPNLLALPSDEVFQSCIEPTPSNVIVHFDYGAFELRILAALSGDKTLIDIFNSGDDIHSMVAQEIFKEKVSKSHNTHLRDQAKLLNFGLIYGMGEAALAKQLKISSTAASHLFSNYFKRFPAVAEFLRSLEESGRSGIATTLLGRRAFLDKSDRGHMARVARNIPIQGCGADIVKLALCRVSRALSSTNAHVINLVHDELVIECHKDELDTAVNVVSNEMKTAFSSILPSVLPEVSVRVSPSPISPTPVHARSDAR